MRRIEEELNALRTGGQEDRDLALPAAHGRALDAVDRFVCQALDLRPPDLRRRGRGGAGAREVAVEVAARTTSLALRRIGEHYGLCASGVTMARRRLRAAAWQARATKPTRSFGQ